MNTPRYLIGTALLFWSWATGIWWLGITMALVLEAANFIRTRWDFSDSDLKRIFQLCTVLFVGAGIYCFISRNTTNDVMTFLKAGSYTEKGQAASQAFNSFFYLFQWWPMALFPMAAAQVYGSRVKLPFAIFTTFSWFFRKKTAQTPGGINIGYLYFAIVMLASSVTNRPGMGFYLGFSLLVTWGLWGIRPARFSAIIWVCFMLAVMKAGFWGHTGIHTLQGKLEDQFADLASRFARKPSTKLESSTGIGHIGQMKLSGKIVLRIMPEGERVPLLLRDASYNIYKTATWYVNRRDFTNVVAEGETANWRLLPPKANPESVMIAKFMDKGEAYLPLPNGTSELQNLPVATLLTNFFGVTKALSGPDLLEYRALYGAGATIDSTTNSYDLQVPDLEKPAMEKVVAQLDLETKGEAEKLKAVEDFFQKNFEYSTYLSIKNPGAMGSNTALGVFLLERRSGHCEYFGTATVLLLRQLGIPARYVNGYSVQEKERNGPKYIVRERHAHAWCLYYSSLDNTWHDFDTTPASWMEVENKNAGSWESFKDFWSNLWYKFSHWRWLGERVATEKYLGITLGVLVVFLLWRLFYGKQRTRLKKPGEADADAIKWPGLDSEFFLVEKRLSQLGLSRYPGETLAGWLKRLETASAMAIKELQGILVLHYRYRFDPKGITVEERNALRKAVTEWLERNREAKTVA